jgi:hypothetical protein
MQSSLDHRPAIASKKLFFVTSEAKRSESFLFLFFAFGFDPRHERQFMIYIIDFFLFLFLS